MSPDLLVKKKPIILIEDSNAICILLRDFLNKLGYEKIHICNKGQEGIDRFKSIIGSGDLPIILLDYSLPDMDARSIMTQMFALKPNVKVILVTATERTDKGIKELIAQGAYQYIEKPVRFDYLKQVITTLEEESMFSERGSAQVAEIKKQIQVLDHLDFILKSHKQISLKRMVEYTSGQEDEILLHLKELEKQGKIVNVGEKKNLVCNQCDSVQVTQVFSCPACNGSNFKNTKLLEHYECGDISEEIKYENDLCPKCRKQIKVLGVDYQVIKNHFICNSCNEIFSEVDSSYLCLKCESKFKLDDANWKSSPCYKSTNM